MTCKDCIHEKVCDALIKSGCPYLDEEVPADAFCMGFRNTTDVVPKSEIEELIRENESLAKTVNEASSLIRKLRNKVEKSRVEVAREIFAEIEEALILSKCYGDSGVYFEHDIETDIAELKKKYTESENG